MTTRAPRQPKLKITDWFPTQDFITINLAGTWGWVTSRGVFQSNPLRDARTQHPMSPADVNFRIARIGQRGAAWQTAWKRNFANGYVLVTDMSGVTHEYAATAKVLYLDNGDIPLAAYEVSPTQLIRRLHVDPF